MLIELKLLGKQKAPQPDGAAQVATPVEPPPQSSAAVTEPLDPVTAPEVPAAEEIPETPPNLIYDGHMGTRILLCGAVGVAFWYLNTSALRYLQLSPDTYGIFWPRREWLFAHALTGILALVLGPLQFWPGLKQRHPAFHRGTGVIYASSAGIGAIAALYLAFRTDFGWMYAMGLTSMAMAWLISTGLAVAAIYQGMLPQHREWMIRSYVVTFGFVMLRVVTDVLEMRGIGSVTERLAFGSWICWSVPLLITETLLQGRKVFATTVEERKPSVTV
jgi:uncharacterized membrane protein